MALRNNVGFEYEGSVMSGTPVLRMARRALAGSGIHGFQGILNGTSNFVLGRMAEGLELSDAVKEAQELGYAEADPTADIEGHDVALKVVILANELLGANLRPQDVSCAGISGITPADIEAAARSNERWRLIGSASINTHGRVEAQVAPQRVPLRQPLAGVNGATNAISFSTDLLGTVTVIGPGAGRIETAYALLSDIIAIHQSRTAANKKAAA
jgi:homoserine dehydrogenase